MNILQDFIKMIMSNNEKLANHLHKKSGIIWKQYFFMVGRIIEDFDDKKLENDAVGVQMHNFISKYDCTLAVALYNQSILEQKK